MPSHKEVLQQRFDEAEHVYREQVEETNRLSGQVKAERNAIDQLQADYDSACRAVASGASAEPASIITERDRRSHKLRGLETLHKESTDRLQPLYAAHAEAARALQDEIDREEIARLEGVITAAKQERDKTQTAFNVTQQAVDAAIWALTRFRRKLELEARAAQRVVQGRA